MLPPAAAADCFYAADKIASAILQPDYYDPTMTILLDTILAVSVVLQYCFVVAMMTVEEDVEILLHYFAVATVEEVLEKEAMIPHEVGAVLNYPE